MNGIEFRFDDLMDKLDANYKRKANDSCTFCGAGFTKYFHYICTQPKTQPVLWACLQLVRQVNFKL